MEPFGTAGRFRVDVGGGVEAIILLWRGAKFLSLFLLTKALYCEAIYCW